MRETEPRYKIPCRHYFQATVLPSMYEDCKEKISSLLATAQEVSLISDVWTSSVNDHSFMEHFPGPHTEETINDYDVVLSAKHFPGPHTGEAINDILKEV
ncbi:hypothetical protein AVEN_99273-1 [Araneus ventricosus]|uniref:Uncharacterized protein n=1 Tax=Araneus ventricosus TaxID=182803 RepID=A0A4Y2KE80_ARAVE|nr:hypothetical protein AVEN_99273-1 [Araneus ventricosus]